MKAEEPCQCCFTGLLAMETGDEDRFERDERLRVQNPAGSIVVSSGAASAPRRETSSSAKMLLYVHTRPDDHVGAIARFWRHCGRNKLGCQEKIFNFP